MADGAYAWLRAHGCWLARGAKQPATHLLLDGGRAAVSDELHGAFLNAYAAAVVRGRAGAAPCLVELRTPVFKLFVDIDARFVEEPHDPAAAAEGVLRVLARVVSETFTPAAADDDTLGALVCVSTKAKREKDGLWKRGLHVIWPRVLATPETALLFRDAALAALADEPAPFANPFANDFANAIDACVYRSNGLRMPWSAKGKGDAAVYVPVARVSPGGDVAAVPEPTTVPEVRDLVRQLSIRTYGEPATDTTLAGDDDPAAPDHAAAAAVSTGDLAQYGDVLEALDAALPVQFAGQRFTGLVRGDGCFMLRSTSRWCGNLGREHRTNNVYFVLTRKGVHQRCYCRCDTTDGRQYGLCKDYCSDTWPVEAHVVEAFFAGEVAAPTATEAHRPLPSQSTKRALSFDRLLEQRAEAGTGGGKRRRNRK